MARRAFGRASRRAWIVWTLVLLALGGAVLATWGIVAGVEVARFRHLAGAPGTDAAVCAEDRAPGGRAHHCAGTAGGSVWPPLRSRMAQPRAADHDRPFDGVTGAHCRCRPSGRSSPRRPRPTPWRNIERIVGLREKLFNANSAVYLLVLIWWIVCLWIDEPGTARRLRRRNAAGEIACQSCRQPMLGQSKGKNPPASGHNAKSMNPRSGSVETSFTVTRSPTSRPFGSRLSHIHQHSVHVRIEGADERAVVVDARDDGLETLADARMQHHGGNALLHLALHLARAIFHQRAALRNRIEVAFGVGLRAPVPATPSSAAASPRRGSGDWARWNACNPAPPGRSAPVRLRWASPAHTRPAPSA